MTPWPAGCPSAKLTMPRRRSRSRPGRGEVRGGAGRRRRRGTGRRAWCARRSCRRSWPRGACRPRRALSGHWPARGPSRPPSAYRSRYGEACASRCWSGPAGQAPRCRVGAPSAARTSAPPGCSQTISVPRRQTANPSPGGCCRFPSAQVSQEMRLARNLRQLPRPCSLRSACPRATPPLSAKERTPPVTGLFAFSRFYGPSPVPDSRRSPLDAGSACHPIMAAGAPLAPLRRASARPARL